MRSAWWHWLVRFSSARPPWAIPYGMPQARQMNLVARSDYPFVPGWAYRCVSIPWCRQSDTCLDGHGAAPQQPPALPPPGET